MSLASEYKRQRRWRHWRPVLDALPSLQGACVLDLGCGVGDQAAELVARGARVTGYDSSAEMIGAARASNLPMAEFQVRDLREDFDPGVQVDGIWCSFTAAFFPDLSAELVRWARSLKPGGWIVITEIDDLFGHEPLAPDTRALLKAYAEEAILAGRYDFHMGRKLQGHLRQAGFSVRHSFTIPDQELSFDGPAHPDVLDAWRKRLARMTLLRHFCGDKAHLVERDFLSCLGRDDHRSAAKVHCCIASPTEVEKR